MTPGRRATREEAAQIDCVHEAAVAAAVRDGHGLDGRDDPLAAHAAACPVCRDVAAIAALLHEGPSQLRTDVRVPSAGQVWWRTVVRARLEDTERAARPMLWAQGLAVVVLGASGLGIARAAASTEGAAARAWAWLGALAPASDAVALRLAALPGPVVWAAGALALSVVVVPLVAVLASRGE
ncbi:MAG: hypothetical protein AB7O28_06265 [Vicinamibacterales bacterium]